MLASQRHQYNITSQEAVEGTLDDLRNHTWTDRPTDRLGQGMAHVFGYHPLVEIL